MRSRSVCVSTYRQIESDLASGKLDAFIAKAEADIAANNVKDLNEVTKLRGILKDNSLNT